MNNESITLFCKHIDKVTRKEVFRKIYFHNVDWQQDAGIKYLKYTKSSMNTDYDVLIFVPYHNELKYITPKKYEQLENKEGYYTLKTHDKIVKGIIDFEITDTSKLRELELNYDDVVNILRVEDCNMFNHFELECE